MDSKTPIAKLAGIGKYYSFKLKRLGIATLEDLIYHFPFRYDDFANVNSFQNIAPGQKINIGGIVWQIRNIRTRSGKFITRAVIAADSGTIEVIWFNQPFLTKNIKCGMHISLLGKVELEGKRLKMLSPGYEIIRGSIGDMGSMGENKDEKSRFAAVYPETEGITSKWLSAKIGKLLPEYLEGKNEFVPYEIGKKLDLIGQKEALFRIHFPKSARDIEEARRRLAFEELFLIQILTCLRKKSRVENQKAAAMRIDAQKILEFENNLPFKLTGAQKKAGSEILNDLRRKTAANRLLLGDVGSGKTVVAAQAAYMAFLNGFDTLFAAPTEILAFQHYKTLSTVLSDYGLKIGIWTASRKINGDVVCGTHALLTSFRAKKPIGLVIIDEQHRFGVAQRARLSLLNEGKITPHTLTMTATPIPRTLALTIYGDLDFSVLDEMPLGRQKIATHVVPAFKRGDAYGFVEKQVREGRQAFIITPFVEPSETMVSVRAATHEFQKLRGKFGGNIKLGLLHGRLKSGEKEEMMDKFKHNKINILVATPVVEVGIDVANATVMMIESAERFGLAQLHQLRGRVGRGEHKSYCLLFTDSQSQTSFRRLKSMEKIDVGFELAEIDLKMRGQGEIFGFAQSGFASLKIADISDHKLVAGAQKEARLIVDSDPTFKKYPDLARKVNQFKAQYLLPN